MRVIMNAIGAIGRSDLPNRCRAFPTFQILLPGASPTARGSMSCSPSREAWAAGMKKRCVASRTHVGAVDVDELCQSYHEPESGRPQRRRQREGEGISGAGGPHSPTNDPFSEQQQHPGNLHLSCSPARCPPLHRPQCITPLSSACWLLPLPPWLSHLHQARRPPFKT